MKSLSREILDFLQTQYSNAIQIIPLKGDASQRRYYRLMHKEKTSILMVGEPFDNPETFPFLSVREHLAKHNVNVPTVINQAPHLGVILLEDLGDITLECQFWKLKDQKDILPFYKKAIDELIKIHFDCTRDTQSSCTAFQNSFHTDNLLYEMNYGKKHFLETMMGIRIRSQDLSLMESCFKDICTQLHQQKKYICHRDYHSRNLMIHKDKIRVIDFQDARLGPIPYDLVSLCHDSYVELNGEAIDTLLNYYDKQVKDRFRETISKDELNHIFHLQTIQRCFKVCGSFSSFYNLRKDHRYLKYLHGTINKVDKALEPFPSYSFFRRILKETGCLEKDFTIL